MLDSTSFDAGGETYHVRYTARARYLFEQLAGYPLHGLLAVQGKISDVELPRLVLAGLEGHRCRSTKRTHPWTMDDVLDRVLGDVSPAEGLAILAACTKAVNDAFSTAAKAEAAEGAEGKAATTV